MGLEVVKHHNTHASFTEKTNTMDLKNTNHADKKSPMHDGATDKNGAAPKSVMEELRQAAPAAPVDKDVSAAERRLNVRTRCELAKHP
jgi:hypothetical protein